VIAAAEGVKDLVSQHLSSRLYLIYGRMRGLLVSVALFPVKHLFVCALSHQESVKKDAAALKNSSSNG
jgi:hypothetical protein